MFCKASGKIRCRDLLIQICDAEDVRILKGVVWKDRVHMHIEYPPKLALADLLKRLKRRLSRLLQQEFRHLAKNDIGAIRFGQPGRESGVLVISQKKRCKDILSIIGSCQTRIQTRLSLKMISYRSFSFQISYFEKFLLVTNIYN